MKIHRGTQRIAVEVPWLGIVLKFPINKFGAMIRDFPTYMQYYKPSVGDILEHVFSEFYFRNIIENWNEFLFYIDTMNQFCQPTYFPFFGLVNIQRLGKPFEMTEHNFIMHMQLLLKARLWENPHTFSDIANFCLDSDGKVRILDYGDERVQGVLRHYGERCYAEFSPLYISKEGDWAKIQAFMVEYRAEREAREAKDPD